MRKQTTSLDALSDQLRCVAAEVQTRAGFRVEQLDQDLVSPDTLVSEFFSFGAPSPAPIHGLGHGVRVRIGWIWWPADMTAADGAKLVANLLAQLPGVEAVSEPILDPQLGLIWRAEVTLRLSQ